MLANPYEIFARAYFEARAAEAARRAPRQRHARPDRASCLARICASPSRQPAGRHRRRADRERRQICFTALGGSPRVEAFWRPGFARFAKWFAETEPARRSGVVKVAAEVDGDLDLAVGRGFRLTVRADRIDLCEDGSVVIYDYKTGEATDTEPGRQAVRAAASARSRDRRGRRLRRRSGRAR